jgi:hypothetical protein
MIFYGRPPVVVVVVVVPVEVVPVLVVPVDVVPVDVVPVDVVPVEVLPVLVVPVVEVLPVLVVPVVVVPVVVVVVIAGGRYVVVAAGQPQGTGLVYIWQKLLAALVGAAAVTPSYEAILFDQSQRALIGLPAL